MSRYVDENGFPYDDEPEDWDIPNDEVTEQQTLTDNDIIKALECCRTDNCDECPCDLTALGCDLEEYAIDLIKRLKAEIERLESEIDNVNHDYILLCSDVAENRAEAIKEFAEKLKANTVDWGAAKGVQREVDNLVKEMVGDNNDQ